MIEACMTVFLQDLIERAAAARQQDLELSRNPLREVAVPEFAETGGTHKATLPKDVGGISFDPRELILALFEQETSDRLLNEIVSTAEHELASNGLTLLCQASPTLCNTIKHQRANANAMLQALQQQLAVLESKLPGLTRIIKAEMIHGCFEEKLKSGVPVPQAMRECLSARKLRSLAGKVADELDLAKEIGALFGLPKDDEDFLSRILRHVRITPDGVEVDLAKPRVDQIYWRLREKYYDRWRRTFEGLKEGKVDELLFYDGPPKRPLLRRSEAARIAALPEWLRVRIVSSSSSAMAYHELNQKASQVDGYLLATSQAPGASEGIRQAALLEREELQRQIRKLDVENEREQKLQDALLMSRDASEAHVAYVLKSRLADLQSRKEGEAFEAAARPWGECCSKEKK